MPTQCPLPSLPELALRTAAPTPSSILLRPASCHTPLQPGSLTSDPAWTPASSLPQSILPPPPVRGPPAGLPRLSWPCPLQLVLCPPHPTAAGNLAAETVAPQLQPFEGQLWPLQGRLLGSHTCPAALDSSLFGGRLSGPPFAMSFSRAGTWIVHLCPPTGTHVTTHWQSLWTLHTGTDGSGAPAAVPAQPLPISGIWEWRQEKEVPGVARRLSQAQGSPAGRQAGWG